MHGGSARSAEDVTFNRTANAFTLGSGGITSYGSFNFVSLTTQSGASTLTVRSGGTGSDPTVSGTTSLNISGDFSISSAVNLGDIAAGHLGGSSAIGSVAVSGTTTINAGGSISLSRNSVGATTNLGYLQMAGGTLNLTDGTAAGNGTTGGTSNTLTVTGLNGSSGVIQLNKASTSATLVVASAANTVFGGTIQTGVGSTLSLTKSGAATLNLTAANTYTGTTQVTAGTLLVNNTAGSATGSGQVVVSANAVLGGEGIIAGATIIDGSLRPGNSIGTLTVQNNVTWNSGDDWVFELGSAAPDFASAQGGSSTQDMLSISGNLLEGSGTGFTFDFAGTGEAGWYKLVDWTSTTTFDATDFSGVNLGSGLSVGTFVIDGTTSALYVQIVPEPSMSLLVTMGLVGLMVFRRRSLAN